MPAHLMCLHGGASRPATWDRVSGDLAALGYRVHTPALPGHEGDRRPDYPLTAFRDHVLAELDRAGAGRVTLVGHSLGAFVATLVAVARPDRVERLVLEEVPIPPRDATDGRAARSTAGQALLGLARLRPGRGGYDPRMLRQVLAQLRTPQPAWWDGLPAVTAPALLLAGGGRSHLDQSRFDLLAHVLPGAVRAEVPVGHRIHSLAPERWLAEVVPFLSA